MGRERNHQSHSQQHQQQHQQQQQHAGQIGLRVGNLRAESREELLRKVLQRLREAGYHLTHQREQILQEILNFSSPHFTADELYTAMRNKGIRVGRATIYNTLEVLERLGVLRSLIFRDSIREYEVITARSQHDHLVCKHCGQIVDFCDPRITQIKIQLGRQTGFRILQHSLVVYGICSECQKRRVGESGDEL